MKNICIIVIFLCIGLSCLFPEETNTESSLLDILGFNAEISGVPYYFEPTNALNSFALGGSAEGLVFINPFSIGLMFDISSHFYLQNDFAEISNGSWTVIRLDITGGWTINEYFNIKAGIGGTLYQSYFSNYPDPIVFKSYSFLLGLTFFLDIGIQFGIDWYDIIIRSEFDFYPDQILYGGIRNNFHIIDNYLILFAELGVQNINESDVIIWPDSFPGFHTTVFVASIGISCKLGGTSSETIKNDPEEKSDQIDKTSASTEMAELKKAKTGDVITFTNIIFNPDKSIIKAESFPVLNEIAAFLADSPDISIELRGYTNALGTPDQEQELSKARADAVKAFLLKKGIASYRIVTVGYGSLFAQKGNIVEANRRVEIKILSRDIK